jgi:dihydroorotate dehydrogenase (NAD+) catalytic subunit
MAIDIDTYLPILGNRYGGLSGPAIKPIAVRCIYELYESVKIPLVGVGGVASWEDAVEFLLAGASSIQVGTALARGLSVFGEIVAGIRAYMRRKGFRNLSEMIGHAHR